MRSVVFLTILAAASNCNAQAVKDWDKFEKQIKFQIAQSITSTDERIRQFALTDEQISTIKKLRKEHSKSEAELRQRQNAERQKGNQLWREGHAKEAQQIFDRLKSEKYSIRLEFTRNAETVLLTHQTKLLKQIAKRSTAIRKASTGDFFGIPLALANEIGVAKPEERNLETKVRQERKKYYLELEDLRGKAIKKVLASLTTEKRKLFKEKFGEIYDAKAEEIRAWDDYRK